MSRSWAATCLCALALLVSVQGLRAADHYGQVTFTGLPVPGASVTATQGDTSLVAISDQQGVYHLAGIAAGIWTIKVEMLGFAPLTQDITIASDSSPRTWELALMPFDEIARGLPPRAVQEPASPPVQDRRSNKAAPAAAPGNKKAFQRADVTASGAVPAPAPDANPFADEPNSATAGIGAADGLLINGSVNNGAASPFAQARAFGNGRPGQRSLYNGGLGLQLGNSAFDARPFSFTGQPSAKPSYSDEQFLGTFGGQLRIPHVVRSGPIFYVGYQHITDHNASTQSALMPTALERAGDFSQSRDALGRTIQIVDPATGQPFPGNIIDPGRISPQAAALLGYYPLPNISGGGFNYQTPVLAATHQDSVQSRLTQNVNGRNQLSGNLAYQRTTTDSASVFAFVDSARASSLDTVINWSHRVSLFHTLRLHYQYTRQTTDVTPYFANRTNVSGNAGIAGNNQDPLNWGAPALIFSSGLAGLASPQYASNVNQTHGWGAESAWNRGRHNVTFGGDMRRQRFDVFSQQDARGAFAFTGLATGSDLADFLLGIPHTSSIAFGNADKHLRAPAYDASVNDDWRLSPTLTINAGLRWEYEAPFTETLGRLVNLDVAPGFSAVSPVLATNPSGAITGQRYPDSLLHPDRRGLQPRVGVAWRPVPGSSLVVRAGYGVYRNTSVYQSISLLMAQQPPLSKTSSVENSAAHPITLANGFTAVPGATSNTLAVDPDFRVGYARNWQASVQRDLHGSLTITGTYLGAAGSRLMQAFLPNTYPTGATNPCATCPAGFVYVTSNGTSRRHAGQVQLRRRLRNGLSATTQYTLSKATDNAAAFSPMGLAGALIAQNWLDLEAERGLSSFDQRHALTAQFEYTTGVGVAGGALLTGMKGTLFKGWTFTGQLTTGSGLPLTPVYLTPVQGTGVTGTIRGDLTGAPVDAAPDGYYVNPVAFAAPQAGHWGSAGRNSVRGPAQFSLNGGITRTFMFGNRLNLDWRIDATNLLNRVTYADVNMIVTSPQFGLPNRANPMRKVQTSLRLRF